jgi:hypothetical protein
MVGGDETLDACASLGAPKVPTFGRFLDVRCGSGGQYEVVDRLSRTDTFYICGASEDGKWIGIVYAAGGLPEGPGRTTTRSLRGDSLLREVEGSRERLGVEAIDFYQIHWPVPEEEIEEGWSTLAELKERGVVRPEQVDPIVAAANLTLDQHDIATIPRRK